jgi:hypothetical protein
MDYLLWCQANSKPDNLLSLISWPETSYYVCQRAENEYFKETSKTTINSAIYNSKIDFV